MTYEDHIERTAAAAREIDRLDYLDSKLDMRDTATVAAHRVALAEATRESMAAADVADVFCEGCGIDGARFERDVEVRLRGRMPEQTGAQAVYEVSDGNDV